MLIGGFYHIDLELMKNEPRKDIFSLRCDVKNNYERKIYTNNGRTATVYALQNGIKPKKGDIILVPDYLCISVINSLEVTEGEFRFYHVRADLTIDLEDLERKLDDKVKVLYVIHYFGIPQPLKVVNSIKKMKEQYGFQLVEDLTQTLYSKDTERMGFGDYLVSSTRKWLPVTDGGLLAVRNGAPLDEVPMEDGYDEAVYRQLLISIARDQMQMNAEEKESINEYLQLEKAANAARYFNFTPKKMTEATRRVLFQYNHQQSMKKRRDNYMTLYHELEEVPALGNPVGPMDSEGNYVPFGFVVLVERREEFYWYLAERGIIGEIQWVLPTEYYQPGKAAEYLSEHNLMLSCDQRYGEKEMLYVAEVIKEYFRR